MKLVIANDLGCVYRLNNNQLEYAPMISMDKVVIISDDEFSSVEPDLVGEEVVEFNGIKTTLYHVFDLVTNALKEK